MSDENEATEVVETAAETVVDKETAMIGKIDEFFNPAPKAEADGAPADDTMPETEETTTEELPATEVVDEAEKVAEAPVGVSPSMRLIAREAGVKESVIKNVASDEALEEIVVETVEENRQKEAEQTPEPEPPFKLELPEEDFPADDPVRKQFQRMHEHYEKRDKLFESAALTLIKEVRELREESQQQRQTAEQMWLQEFHTGLDELESKSLGKASESNDDVNDLRESVFKSVQRLAKQDDVFRKLSPKEQAQKAAVRLGLTKAQAEKEAVREMHSQKIGRAHV